MNVFREIRHIFKKVTNALSYLPLLYNFDYEWNSSTCMLRIMKYKLQRTEKCMGNGYHLFKPAVFRKMKTMNLLIDRILADNYHENVFLHHNRKWGESHINWDGPKTLAGREIILSRPNASTPELKEQERKEFRALIKKENALVLQDIELLFKLYSKNFHQWSD